MRPDQAASRCLLVGDPQRVELARPFFSKILHEGAHREFRWLTGLYEGQLLSVIGTGIGPDNTEIALLELEALHNIDLSRGLPFPTRKKLYLLRIGTSGLLQPQTPVGTVVFTDWAIGIDPLPYFLRELH
jgi:uridine phosphorylase